MPRMRRALGFVVVLSFISGCGDGGDSTTVVEDTTSPAKAQADQKPVPEPESKPTVVPKPTSDPEEVRTGPNEMQDAAFNESKELCSLFSAQQLASEFGGKPSDSLIGRTRIRGSELPAWCPGQRRNRLPSRPHGLNGTLSAGSGYACRPLYVRPAFGRTSLTGGRAYAG
jgi:hypothetical protein